LEKREVLAAPSLRDSDLTLTFRVLRDLFTKKVERLLIDSIEEYEAVKEFVHRVLPEQTNRIHFYDKEESLFIPSEG